MFLNPYLEIKLTNITIDYSNDFINPIKLE